MACVLRKMLCMIIGMILRVTIVSSALYYAQLYLFLFIVLLRWPGTFLVPYLLLLSTAHRFGELLDGRYEITAAHGKGVFSTVVRAKDLKAGKNDPEVVAIKIIRKNETM